MASHTQAMTARERREQYVASLQGRAPGPAGGRRGSVAPASVTGPAGARRVSAAPVPAATTTATSTLRKPAHRGSTGSSSGPREKENVDNRARAPEAPRTEERLLSLEKLVENLSQQLLSSEQTSKTQHAKQESTVKEAAALQQRIWELEAANQHATEELRTSFQRIASLEQSNQRSQAELRHQLQRSAMLEQQKAAVETANAEIKARLSVAEANCDQLRVEGDALEKRCTLAEEDNKRLLALVATQDGQLRQAELERRRLHEDVQQLRGNIRVLCRVKPLSTDEPGMDLQVIGQRELVVASALDEHGILGDKQPRKSFSFSFDRVFDGNASQATCFDEISMAVQSALDGYNVCVFTYGQTGSGKTHTMEGGAGKGQEGMIPRSVGLIWGRIASLSKLGWSFAVSAQYIEIYNETIRDLLGNEEPSVKHNIVHNRDGTTSVTDVRVVGIQSAQDVHACLAQAAARRSVGATQLNERSSRSHSVFTLWLRGQDAESGRSTHGVLHLVDLAGSERLSASKAEGQRLKETQAINKSLSALGDVIAALANGQGGTGHVPFRNSKLTYLLQSSLGGASSKTLMFATISQRECDLSETLSSLRFATKVNSAEIGVARKKMSIQ